MMGTALMNLILKLVLDGAETSTKQLGKHDFMMKAGTPCEP